MAAYKPLPHDLVERVLLSPDLVPSILGSLETEDGAAAAVCKQWLVGWQATHEPRHRQQAHVRLIIFDSHMYKEGRPCLRVRTADRPHSASSQHEVGDWIGARVLIWRDPQYATHVMMVKAVSKPEPPKAPTRCSQVPSRPQIGPPVEFTAADHQFVTRGRWTLAVVENDESTHAEVCDFGSTALRDVFMRRLQEGTALIGDDAGLTRLRCPCAEDLQGMLDGSLPSLPLGLLDELVADMQGSGVGGTGEAGVQLQLLHKLREKAQGGGVGGIWSTLAAEVKQLLERLHARVRDAMNI